MQQNKSIKFNGELSGILKNPNDAQEKLQQVVGFFDLKKRLTMFDSLKAKGFEASQLLLCLVLISFHGVNSIYALVTDRLTESKKDALYGIKNNEYVDWRQLLMLMAMQFRRLINSRDTLKKEGVTALIGDDSPMRKTGKKMENVSRIHDHVSNTFILGFKIMVVGFWDGGSFIPLDLTIHREKGGKLRKAREGLASANKMARNAKAVLDKAQAALCRKQESVSKHRLNFKEKVTNTNLGRLESSLVSLEKGRQKVKNAERELKVREHKQEVAESELAIVKKKYPEYGLGTKEKKQQFNKKRATGSCGYSRSKEADESKINMFISIIRRVVKKGFVPDYVLSDTWFFCMALLIAIDKLSGKGVKLLSMAKMGNATYELTSNGKSYNAHALLKIKSREARYSRKLKAHYIKVPAMLSGIRINLFLVRFGNKATWRLMVTNDLDLSFVKMIEVYQIRWSIEVFFKECKQYLNLGGSSSSDFDGQIADATLSMIRYIMLSFYKRINYQQSFGELFKQVSKEITESSMVEKLWEVFLETMIVIAEIMNVDAMELQIEAMRHESAMMLMKKLVFQKNAIKNAS